MAGLGVPEAVLIALVPIGFALFWLGLGIFFGIRLGERRLVKRIRDMPASTPLAAHLGNTVARTAGRGPSGE